MSSPQARRHAISRAAALRPGQTGTGTLPGGDWLAEREQAPVPASSAPGVPVNTGADRPASPIESRRGAHKTG